ncbi:NUDIX hydrolase [candidate division TA06 bacterium]|nr:NUDIX hydrolase [candidate division TA06 bacterium]
MPWPTHIVAAAGYVFDKNDNLLIVKTEHRGWDCTGGQIASGESLEEGVLREILEENGIKASVRCLAGIYSNVGQDLFHDGTTTIPTKVMFDFICDHIDGKPTPSSETSKVIWVPKSKVLEYVTAPACLLRFKNILEFDGRVRYCSYVTKPEFRVLSSRYV